MKTNIRRCVFETNSSSVHTLSFAKESDFENWKHDDEYVLVDAAYKVSADAYDKIYNNIMKKSDIARIILENPGRLKDELQEFYDKGVDDIDYNDVCEIVDRIAMVRCKTYSDWCYGNFDTFCDSYVTEHGDKVVAYGYYGYDG